MKEFTGFLIILALSGLAATTRPMTLPTTKPTTQPTTKPAARTKPSARVVGDKMGEAVVEDPCAGLPREDVNCDGVINLSDALLVKSRIPITKPPPDTQPAIEINPSMGWAQRQAIIQGLDGKGGKILVRGGNYSDPGRGQLYESCISVDWSGVPGNPIVLQAAPGETPVFWGTHPLIWAIRVGYVKYNGTQTGVHDVILDGLRATQAPWDGIEIAHSVGVVVRNCWAYANNYESPNGYKAGINIDAGHDITIDHCRVFDNGFGINAYEDQPDGHEWPDPDGPYKVTISNNFVFGNSRTGNPGNSSGLDIRFATNCTYTGNIFYDNPDAGINGEGHVQCRIVGNISVNNWQPAGNNEGIKTCVRGGGGNVFAFNITASNGNTGFDMTRGAGDIVVNNTVFKNGSWGLLTEGQQTFLFNNVISDNSADKTDNAYPEMDAAGWSPISDYDLFGRGPFKSPSNETLTKIPPNWVILPALPLGIPGVTLPRTTDRQINTPEMLWQVSSIEAARAKIIPLFKMATPSPGTTLEKVATACTAAIPDVQKAIDQYIADAANSTDFQMKQATHRWEVLEASLTSYNLSGLSDVSGKPISTSQPTVMGALQ